MSYCTLADVKGINSKRTYSATTTPTTAQIEDYIDQIAAEMDTVLEGRGLTVPVTTPAAFLKFLVHLNALGASSMAEKAMFPETQGLVSTSSAAVLWKQYREGLDYLAAGNLSSEVIGDATALPFSFFEQNKDVDTEPEEAHDWLKPKFGKNREF